MYMEQIQEVTPDAVDNLDPSLILSHCKRIIDSLDMSYDREQLDQDDDDGDDLANERDLLASLIEKLKCESDDSRNSLLTISSSFKSISNHNHFIGCFLHQLWSNYSTISYLSLQYRRPTLPSIQRLKRSTMNARMIAIVIGKSSQWQMNIPTSTKINHTRS
nr:hypothetical protein [Tanacetum cinerariifolium]